MDVIELIIKIPKKLACEGFERPFTEEEKNILIKAIGNGTPIPDNATNGNVIKALFKPNWIRRMDDVVTEGYEFNEAWWNAPYQKGGKK